MEDLGKYFQQVGGKLVNGFPVIDSSVFHTEAGTPYFKSAGVAMIAKPDVHIETAKGFLDSFDSSLNFSGYLDDPVTIPPGERLVKFAGQTCYASFGPNRTMNSDAQKYIDNLVASGHGSVEEHANYSFLVYGIDRSVTHEWVRHRVGKAYSQESQRYVSGRVLRFVERPEYQSNEKLHQRFENRIDRSGEEYEAVAQSLLGLQSEGLGILTGETKTDRRKKVNQAARSVLPNETEAFMVVTGNARAWRHVSEMRASEHADVQIRDAAFRVFLCLVQAGPMLFGDIQPVELPDGTMAVKSEHPKV